ncbi:MAG: hypothetical protein WA970_24260 [Gammaproteobacteria bacterium]
MQAYVPQHLERFLYTLRLVSREVTHLQETQKRLFDAGLISADWVKNLTADDPAQDTLEAFASRFGRLQNSLADKLLPRLALLEGEKPGSAIDNLNRAERLGLISSTKGWLAMRALRNKLVPEYVDDPSEFANALNQAESFVPELVDAYQRIRTRAEQRLGTNQARLFDSSS